MSLREGPPSRAFTKLVKVIEDVETGKKGSREKLYKYVESGVITAEQYKELTGQNDASFSLKGGASATELFYAIENYKNGKKNSEKKLYKYVVDGALSRFHYEQILEKYGSMHRINKDKKDRENSRLSKDRLYSILAVVIIFISMLCGLAYLVEQYGKGVAVWYIFSWVWALSYAFSSFEDVNKKIERENERLKHENDWIKEKIKFYEAQQEHH